jgi:hypothetical protein
MGQAAADCLPLSLPPSFPLTLAFVCYLASLPFFPPRLIVHACVRACVRACVQASERASMRPFVHPSVFPLHKRLGIHLVSFFLIQCFFVKILANFRTTGDKKIVTCECYKGFFYLIIILNLLISPYFERKLSEIAKHCITWRCAGIWKKFYFSP